MEKNNKSSSNEDYIIDELKYANDKINKLQSQNNKLIEIIKANDLEDELEEDSPLSVEESICINGLSQLAELFEKKMWGKDEIQAYDILHKNYRLLKGQGDLKPKKSKKADVGELLNIVKELRK